MKLRLNAKGFETYTGQMGVVNFENGLSVGDVLPVDAVRIAGVLGAEWEDGSPANVGQMYLDNMNTNAPTPEESRVNDNPDAPKTVATFEDQKAAAEAIGKTYSEDELAAVADTSGIAGLREIADPLGIKSNSIRGLIDAILKVAAAPKAE